MVRGQGGICGSGAGFIGSCVVTNCLTTGVIGEKAGGICGDHEFKVDSCVVRNSVCQAADIFGLSSQEASATDCISDSTSSNYYTDLKSKTSGFNENGLITIDSDEKSTNETVDIITWAKTKPSDLSNMYVPSFFELVKDWFTNTPTYINSTMYSIFAQRADLLTQDSTSVNQLLNIDIDSLSFSANFFLFLFNNSIVPGLQINELTGASTSIINAIDKNSFNSLTKITLTDTALSDLEALIDVIEPGTKITTSSGKITLTDNALSVSDLEALIAVIELGTQITTSSGKITLTDTVLSVSDLEALIDVIEPCTKITTSSGKITLTDTELSVSDLEALIDVIEPGTIIDATSVTKLTGDRDKKLNLNKNPYIILSEAVIPKFWSNPIFIGGIISGIVGIGGFIYYSRKRKKD